MLVFLLLVSLLTDLCPLTRSSSVKIDPENMMYVSLDTHCYMWLYSESEL